MSTWTWCCVLVAYRVEVVEEANGGRLRAVHGELEVGLHVQGGRKDRRTPEESRKWPRPMNTSCRNTSRIKAFIINHMTVVSTLAEIPGALVLLANLLYLALALQCSDKCWPSLNVVTAVKESPPLVNWTESPLFKAKETTF